MKSNVLRVIGLSVLIVTVITARPTPPKNEFFKLPIKEITVFKDGHAFVLHEGTLPVDEAGNVVMDYLPAPILGAFWPYSADKSVKLTGVVAGQQKVSVDRTALDVEAMIKANIGSEVIIKERNDRPAYPATIVSIPTRSSEELAVTDPVDSTPRLPVQGKIVLLKTIDGTRALDLAMIQDVTFKNQPKTSVASDEFRNRLLLKLRWDGRDAAKTASVGLAYIQKGIRWIPSYRVTLDNSGNALVELSATMVNELTDFEDITTNLVIGVPTFAFKDTPDPIALQQSVAQLSPYFRQDTRTINALSNSAIMTQAAMPSYDRDPSQPGAMDLGPNPPEGTKTEDLFVFTLKHISMKKGERMVVPIAEYNLKYQDVYSLTLPYAPPPEVRGNLNTEQQMEMSRLLNAPKVMHKIRLSNKSNYPLTTAPATIIRDGRVLAQNTMTYTSIGASSDLELTQAIDIAVNKSESETRRIPNAMNWHGDSFARVDLDGKVTLVNHRNQPVAIEINRYVMGAVDKADQNGAIEKINAFEDTKYLPVANGQNWWSWYSWPSWWHHMNGVGRITWKVNLEPGKGVDLGYSWYYYWN